MQPPSAPEDIIDAEIVNGVCPTRQQSAAVLAASSRTWSMLYEQACSLTQFPTSCSTVAGLLNRTPSIPSNARLLERGEGDYLFIEGGSEWDVEHRGNCELDKSEMSLLDHKIILGTKALNTCSFMTSMGCKWPGLASHDGREDEQPNLMGVLILGWAYILSACVVELRGGFPNNQVIYTDASARIQPDSEAPFEPSKIFDLAMGDIEDREARWWVAVLANGAGWRATLTRQAHSYHPPWSIFCNANFQFCLRRSISGSELRYTDTEQPPSSEEAFNFLWRFCQRYQIQDQFSASLAAALTLPRHNRFGATVQLPLPTLPSAFKLHSPKLEHPSVPFEHLPSFAALSSIPRAIFSALCGTFWEPEVECNVVSEWLDVVMEHIIPAIDQSGQGSTIVKMMSIRRPRLASLWLGSLATGLLPTILKTAKELPPISLEASVWTKSPQSFMDPPNHYTPHQLALNPQGSRLIRRQDELRLLFLTKGGPDRYERPPLSPWPPFGMIELSEAAFEAQLHAECQHSLQYRRWVWRLAAGGLLPDVGISAIEQNVDPLPALPLSNQVKDCVVTPARVTETASRMATRAVFGWAIWEGRRTGENDLWSHNWLQDLDDDSEGESI